MVLWQHRRLIVRVAAIALPVSLAIAFLLPKTYTSSASIMPPDQQGTGALMLAALASRTGSLGSIGSLAGGLLGEHATTALFINLLESGTVRGNIIDRFDLQRVYRSRHKIDAAKHLSRRTSISDDKKSGVITIKVEDHNPVRARDIAQAYLDELNRLVNKTSTSAARQERIFIEQRLQSVTHDLEQAQIALSDFSSKNTAVDMHEQTRALVDAGARIQGELLFEQSSLESLRQVYGDQNIRVRETQARIGALQHDLEKMTGASPDAPTRTSDTNPQSAELYPPLRQLPRLAVPYADLYRQVKVQEAVYELLTQQYEMARIEEAKDVPVVHVIDAPGIPEKQSFPPRLLLTALLTAFSIAASAAFILLRQYWATLDSSDPRKQLVGEITPILRALHPRVSSRCRMKRHLLNAIYGLLDYASYPLVMLLAAPIVLRRLGAAEYGLWIIATAFISVGGIIASGFCDANLRRVSSLRRSHNIAAMVRSTRTLLAINLALAATLVIIVLASAPYAAAHLSRASSTSPAECIMALRIAGMLILGRAVESAAISTQRAFESYREPVLISIAVRVLTLASAIALALLGAHTPALLLATGFFLAAGCWMQFRQLRTFFGSASLMPALYRDEIRPLLASGVFVWMQAIGGVIFGYLDRILLGLALGAQTVTPYVLCIQFAQPVFGITASGLHFLFPHLAARVDSLSAHALRRVIAKAVALNLLTVASITGGLLLFGQRFLRVWAGPALANKTHGVFEPIVLGAALTGLSITGVYTLQAMGQFRSVAIILLSCRTAMSLLMFVLLRHEGLRGLVTVRVLYGASTLLIYLPLLPRLRLFAAREPSVAPDPITARLRGGSNA